MKKFLLSFLCLMFVLPLPIQAMSGAGRMASDKTTGKSYTVNNAPLYANNLNFQERDALVVTAEIMEVTDTEAKILNFILDDGGLEIITRGVCYSTSPDPTLTDNKTNDGSGVGNYVSNLIGLTPGTKYYVRAYITNARGTFYANTLTFLTYDIPMVETGSITSVDRSTVLANGRVVEDGGSPVTRRGVCWSKNNNPTIDDRHALSGMGIGDYTSRTSGLNTNTTYYFRAFATNKFGVAYGEEVRFTTPGLPEIATSPVANIQNDNATSGGRIISDGGAPILQYGICWDTNPNPLVTHSSTSETLDSVEFFSHMTGLKSGQTYYVRAYATNIAGTSYGYQYSFTTLSIPKVFSIIEYDVTQNSVRLRGNVTDEGGSEVTKRGFVWNTEPNPQISHNATNDGKGLGRFITNITELKSGTTYYFRSYAQNLTGIAYGEELRITTLDLPLIGKVELKQISHESATIEVMITGDGGAPVIQRGLCYSTNPSPTTASNCTFNGTGTGNFESSITQLTPGTQYYFRAYAINMVGTAYGDEITFKTLNIPEITTEPVTEIKNTTAISGGHIIDTGGAPITQQGICWSMNPNPTIENQYAVANISNQRFKSLMTNLQPGVKYYVRAYATNSAGTAYGDERSFTTTDLATIIINPVSSITNTSARSGANIISDGGTPITKRGVCWSMNPGPTITDYSTADGAGSGVFASQISNLEPGKTYFIRAYAINDAGIAYSNEISFKTQSLATVQTVSITNLRHTGASVTSIIVDDGGSNVTRRGVCWSLNPVPTTADNCTFDGSGPGSFTSNIATLQPGTKYYVRAFATNSIGTAYGSIESFFTINISKIYTQQVVNITATTATAGGEIIHDGGAPITQRGICWSTIPNPTINDFSTSDGTGIGRFSSSLSSLSPENKYYLRAYAINSAGVSYGEEITFTTKASPHCPGIPTVVDIDGNVYNTVLIDNQCWMKENLRTTRYRDGTPIEYYGNNNTYWQSDTKGAYAWYDNDVNNLNAYGALYNWHAVNNPSGLCPAGWHVPGYDEWTTLIKHLGFGLAGGKLKSHLTEPNPHPRWTRPNTGASNISGFTGLPGGNRWNNARYGFLGETANFWSATEYSSSLIWYLFFNNTSENAIMNYSSKTFGFSVRCIRSADINKPIFQNDKVVSVNSNSATILSNISDDFGEEILVRGICWSRNPNPTVDDNTVASGMGAGEFVNYLLNLQPETTYFARAFAISRLGTFYGNEFEFATTAVKPDQAFEPITEPHNSVHEYPDTIVKPPVDIVKPPDTTAKPPVAIFDPPANDSVAHAVIQAPAVRTMGIVEVTSTSALCQGEIVRDGGSEILQKGVCWDTQPWPTIENFSARKSSDQHTFTVGLSELLPDTRYYVRVYAINESGIAYGNQLMFTTLPKTDCGDVATVTDIDGNVYNTVLIGTQCWMAENLKTTRYKNGRAINYPGENNSAWSMNTTGAYAWYDNSIAWKDSYGGLYNWYAVNNPNGLCPSGWRVPTNADFITLTNYLGGESIAGGKLKSTHTEPTAHPRWKNPNTGATNISGFAGYPGGYRYIDGYFYYHGEFGAWWSSTQQSDSHAWYRNLDYLFSFMYRTNYIKGAGFSVRCIKED